VSSVIRTHLRENTLAPFDASVPEVSELCCQANVEECSIEAERSAGTGIPRIDQAVRFAVDRGTRSYWRSCPGTFEDVLTANGGSDVAPERVGQIEIPWSTSTRQLPGVVILSR